MEETNTAHPVSYGIYVLVWFGLVGLTLLTVSVAGLNLVSLTVVTAIAIALIKSLLVTNYFMHIRTDSRVFKVLFWFRVTEHTILIFKLNILFICYLSPNLS